MTILDAVLAFAVVDRVTGSGAGGLRREAAAGRAVPLKVRP
ncbi:hypothetical protein [Kocuria flava]|nr:hypothetical protein [Kocuria flava]